MQHFGVLTLCSLMLASSADAYAFTSPVSVGASSRTAFRSTTGLRAAEGADDMDKASGDGASDILSSPVFLKKKLDVIKSDLAKVDEKMTVEKTRLEEGKAEWGGQLDDLKKEYQNIQDRMSSQSKQGDNQATIKIVRTMLKFLDNSDRAFGSVTPETDAEKAIEAEYKETYDSILATFKEFGVEAVETVGIEFDYEVHQAVMQRPSEDHEEGIVCEELQKGFKLGDVLVRAAMVAVAA